MTTLQKLQESAREQLANHPAMKFANDAIIQQAIRSGTSGYTGKENLNDFLGQIIASTIEEVRKAITMPEREDGIFIPMEMTKSECLDKGWEMCRERMSRRFTELTSEQKEI